MGAACSTPIIGPGAWSWTRKQLRVTGAATDTAVWAAAGAAVYIYLHKIEFTCSSAGTVSFSEGADGATTRIYDGDVLASTTVVLEFPEGQPYRLPANTALNVTNSAGNLKIVVYGVTGPA